MPKAYSLPLSLPILFIYSGIKLKLLQCPLQYAFNVEQCEIIRRCSQLLVIPKCEVKLTCTNSLEHKEGLCSHGIVETVLHPKQIGVASDDIAPRMLIKKEVDISSILIYVCLQLQGLFYICIYNTVQVQLDTPAQVASEVLKGLLKVIYSQ